MNISIDNPIYIIKQPQKSKLTFRGNLVRTANTIHLASNELFQVSAIADQYKKLNLMFKAGGNYVSDLLKKIAFLIAPAGIGFLLKNILKSDDVQDIKLEKNEAQDNLMDFTLCGKDETVKISVSKSGQAQILTDNTLSENDVNKYLNEINKNHHKLFENVFNENETKLVKINKLLCSNSKEEIDLTSPDKIKSAIEQFVNQRKRITALTPLINRRNFIPRFYSETGATISNKAVLENKDIEFYFSSAENKYFNGINLIVSDNKNGTKQGFVAMDDGHIYKTLLHKNDKALPNDALYRNLTILPENELNSPDLKYMFNYAVANTDLVFRYMLDEFYNGEHKKTTQLDKLNEEVSKLNKKTDDKPFAEERAKVVKIYDIKPELMEKFENIENLRSRISKAYNSAFRLIETPEAIENNVGLIRRKFVNDFIVKDIVLPDGMSLGVSKYSFSNKDDELLSFDIYDKNIKQIARFKVMKEGKGKLFVKLVADTKLIENINKILENELNNGLAEKLLPILNDACYYHENYVEIRKYIARAYYPKTVRQAIKEMITPENAYLLDCDKIQKLKNNLDNICEIQESYSEQLPYWQKKISSNTNINGKKIIKTILEDFGINYRASFIDSKDYSGIRIFTTDEADNFTNGYFIDNNGQSYKLIYLPKDHRTNSYIQKTNFSKLNANAVNFEHLNLMLDDLFVKLSAYNEFLMKCVDEYKLNPEEYRDENTLQTKTEAKKRGRPRKIQTDTVGSVKNSVRKVAKPAPNTKVKNKSGTNTESSKIKKQKITAKIHTKQKFLVKEENLTKNIIQKELSSELKSRYASMLKTNGEFKSFKEISMEDVVAQFDRIFALPSTERSSHYIHDIKPDGNVFTNRFSVEAPDGAWITVSKVKSASFLNFTFYTIRVQKGDEIMYININPLTGRVLKCDQNNNIIRDDDGGKSTISKEKFAVKNPLSENMSIYFREIFDERADGERRTIKFQIFSDKKSKLKTEKQAKKDFERAMNSKLSLDFQEEENRI